MITWKQRLENLRKALGREPTLTELLDAAWIHEMTPEEYRVQAESWARSCRPTGDPRFD
jgi:hypothetical protein